MEEKKNVVLIDWFSFTSKTDTPAEIMEILGLEDLNWQDTTGARGYRKRKYYDGISIHYDGREDMGVWCEMSGQGCRNFESLSTVKWPSLIAAVLACSYNLTRMDIAYDDHTGVFDISDLMRDTDEGEFVSKSEWWETIRSSQGKSCMFGSPKSEVRIRIYDKAAERGFVDQHWNRVELQLRNGRALAFCALMKNSIGDTFAGVLYNYLRFVDPDSLDTNRWRWPMKDYWADLINDAKRISIYISPGMEYNEERCRNYVVNQAGNAIAACIEMYGETGFRNLISARKTKPNPKYDQIVSNYKHQLEELKQKKRVQAEEDKKNPSLFDLLRNPLPF